MTSIAISCAFLRGRGLPLAGSFSYRRIRPQVMQGGRKHCYTGHLPTAESFCYNFRNSIVGSTTRYFASGGSSSGDSSPAAASSRLSASGSKVWIASTCFEDHVSVVQQLPFILGAYVGKHAIDPKLNESIMVTVNSENRCPYCTGLHGELARMAGVDKVSDLLNANSVDDCKQNIPNEPAIVYARIFAEEGGRGMRVNSAREEIVKHYGEDKAQSIVALCWFLKWGSIGGNTLNAGLFDRLKGKPVQDSTLLFELIYTTYYGPLFAVIALMNMGLKFMPQVPNRVLSGIGALLTICGGTWMLPVRGAAFIFVKR